MKIWCILCLGLHHYKLKPPIIPGIILPYFINQGCLLWAIECPTHPLTIWVNPNNIILIIAYWVVQAINKVDNNKTVKATSHDHNGSYKCYIFFHIASYSFDDFDSSVVDTIGNDFRIFSACSEWRHLYINILFTWNIMWSLFFIFSYFRWIKILLDVDEHKL